MCGFPIKQIRVIIKPKFCRWKAIILGFVGEKNGE